MTCSTCRWWRPETEPDIKGAKRGRCTAVLPVPRGAIDPHAANIALHAVWPLTLPDDGCMAHTQADALTKNEAAEHVQAVRQAQQPHEMMVCGEINARTGVEL